MLPPQPSCESVWQLPQDWLSVNATPGPVAVAVAADVGRARALPRERQQQHHHAAGERDRDGAARHAALARAVDERHPDHDPHPDRRDDDRAEQHQIRVVEDPQELEEEEVVPVRTRVVDRDRGVGLVLVERAQDAALRAVRGVVPDDRQPHDQEHEEEVDDDVVQDHLREERLPRLLLVAVLAEVRLAALARGQASHRASLLSVSRDESAHRVLSTASRAAASS